MADRELVLNEKKFGLGNGSLKMVFWHRLKSECLEELHYF
jgi:hypothetical protein